MTRVKICGLMNHRDVDLCVRAGADALGFVVDFPQPVPWNLAPKEGRKLIEQTSPFVSTTVVTGGTVGHVLRIAEETRPDIVQLHYEETLAEVKEIAYQLSLLGMKTIKALRIDDSGQCAFEISDPVKAARALAETKISAILVDSYTAARPGGTGMAVNLAAYKHVKQASSLPIILAGGLNPENAYEIVQETRPYAVDVLTGVEQEPGKKDEDKVKRFIKSVKS